MSNELVHDTPSFLPPDLLNEKSKYATDVAHGQMAGSGFLPRLQLFGANSGLVKKGKVPMGHYAIVRGKDNIAHLLSDSIDVLVLGWRPKAMRFGDKTVKVFFDPNHKEFKQIEIDSTKSDSGCMWGPEYLVWVPSVNVIVSFHFNNPTMRQAAGGMINNVGKAVTCKSELIEKGKHSWHGPVILNCSTPLESPPDVDKFRELVAAELSKFNNPKESGEELQEAPKEQADSTGRDR